MAQVWQMLRGLDIKKAEEVVAQALEYAIWQGVWMGESG